MFQGESLCKNFIRGLAFLDSYIKLNNKTRLQDINIISELFCCQLLNVLYGWELADANTESRQMPGFDLFSEKNKIIVQVTSQCRTEKIKDCFEKLDNLALRRDEVLRKIKRLEQKSSRIDEQKLAGLRSQLSMLPDLTGYEVRFLFLTTDASGVRKSAASMGQRPAGIQFDPGSGIMDFTTLTRFVQGNCMRVEQLGKLERFISMNSDLFVQNIPSRDHVQEIIDEYAQNFQSKLFLHSFRNNPVTLQNLYVEPAYQYIGESDTYSRNVPKLLCDFLWKRREVDNERMLFIEGDAAIGKTSLVSWLCYHYNLVVGEQKEDVADAKDTVGEAIFLNRKVVCIRLRELDFTQGRSAKDAVLHYLKIDSIPLFKQRYSGAILILDGADELSMVSGSQIQSTESFLLELQRLFRDHKFIVTTRPKFLNLSRSVFSGADMKIRRVELLHYNQEMRQQWLENYKRCGETVTPATEEYITNLSDELAESVADTPLALYLLVGCDMREELQGNSWALYREIFSSAIMNGELNQYNYNTNFVEKSVLMTQHRAQTNYRVVQNIAFRMFQNAREDRYYLNADEIDEVICASELNGLTKEQVRSTCVLCAYWKNTTTIGALEFYHNNIRDFFLCEYIAEVLIRCIHEHREEPFPALVGELCRIFCWGNISGTTWEQTFALLRLRLMSEKDKDDPNTLYRHLRRVGNLPNVIWHLFVSRDLWNHPSPDIPYVSAKRVLANAMMLVRILMDTEPGRIVHWSDGEQRKDWGESGVFQDWKELLSQSVQQINVASKTVWEDLTWSGYNVVDIDFSESQLQEVYFDRVELSKISFRKAELQNCQFLGAYFHDVDFGSTVLQEVTFRNADLSDIAFTGTHINNCSMLDIQLDSSRFSNCVIKKLSLNHQDREKFIFRFVQFSGCRMDDCAFQRSTFVSVRIENSELENVDCFGGTISGTISDSKFVHFNFIKGDFLPDSSISSEFIASKFDYVKWKGTLTNTTFTRCSFYNCDFSGIRLFRNVVFEDCRFDFSDFHSLHLQGVTFRDSSLYYTVFEDTILDQCNVVGLETDLTGASFEDARNRNTVFFDVDFTGVNFYGSKGFEQYISPAK